MSWENRQRKAAARKYGGVRQAHLARSTGTLVVVVDAEAQGLDPSGEIRWYTICDDHDQAIGHRTLALAKFHAVAPEGWCEVCNGMDETRKYGGETD